MDYIISHDMGTSSVKAALVDFEGNIVASCSTDYNTYYPHPAWVSKTPTNIGKAFAKRPESLIEKTKTDIKNIKGMVFATQAMGIIPIDNDGNTLYNNITWVDGRAEKQAQSIMKKLGAESCLRFWRALP